MQHLAKNTVLTGFIETHHIYMADNSRVSLAGLNETNVAYVADAIAESLKNSPERDF
jgi:aspartate/tyrosine/aromatic aminotransferase